VVLDRPGLPRIIPINLYDHMDRAEQFWSSAEWATKTGLELREKEEADMLVGGDHRYCEDHSCCQICPHYLRNCDPPLGTSKMEMVLDEELVQAEQEYRETLEAAKTNEGAEKILKEFMKTRELDRAVVGKSVLTRTVGTTTSYDIPAEIKAPYAKKVPRVVVKIDCQDEVETASAEALG